MFAWMLAVAMAGPAEEIGGGLPEIGRLLYECRDYGCPRSVAADLWYRQTLGYYERSGHTNGVAAATVRELDPELFAQLPQPLQDSATKPEAWVLWVGGTGRSVLPDVDYGMADRTPPERPVVFVLSESGNPRAHSRAVQRAVSGRLELDDAVFYDGGELCQQGLSARPSWDPSSPLNETLGWVDLAREGSWSALEHAQTYDVWVGGIQMLVVDDQGRIELPAGRHSVALLREDGVGPVVNLAAPKDDFGVTFFERAQQCVEQAIDEAELANHFLQLRRRLPGVPLYLVDLRRSSVSDAEIYSWE